MHDSKETIDKLFAEVERLQARGEYGKCYGVVERLLALCEERRSDPRIRCRILVQAARSAYYVSRFDKSLSLLQVLDQALTSCEIPERHLVVLEAALVRANVYRRQGKTREALEVIEPFRDGSAADIPAPLVAERLLIEGACHFYRNEMKRAEDCLEAALGISTHHGASRLRSRVLTMLGLLAQNKGLPEAAVEYFGRAKDICFVIGDCYGEAAASLNMGILLSRRGRFPDAERIIRRASAIFERIEWRLGVCRCLLALGNISKGQREFAAAIRSYRAALTLAESHDFGRERALALEYIGDVHYERGRYGRAEECYRQGLKLARSMAPCGDIEVELHRRFGELYVAQRTIDSALPHLRSGLKLSQKLKDKLEKGAILRCMGKAAFASGRPQRGAALFRKALAALNGAGCDFELAKVHLSFAELLLAGSRIPTRTMAEHDGSDGLDEAWRNAVEAGHLFGAINSEYWSAAAQHLIDAVATERRRALHRPAVAHEGRSTVTLRCSPEFVLHEGLVAVSPQMVQLSEQIAFASTCTRPVLITGETGTGKELVAQLIHRLSERDGHPFVPLNCAAIPDHLFESEFFGHRRGCFTGALTDRRGLFEEAHRGTLFLDEIGELTTLQQVKLLRVLQEGKVRRLGENIEHPIDVRIISATNQNLEEKLGNATLREDFFYRINAEHIHVSPLRERREDIVPLVAYFLNARGAREDGSVDIGADALRCLQEYSWPGNVRELISVLERVAHISNGEIITLDMLPERIRGCYRGSARRSPVSGGTRSECESRVRRALGLCGGNKSAAARWLGISRGTLYKEIRRMGLTEFTRQRNVTLRPSAQPPHPGNEASA